LDEFGLEAFHEDIGLHLVSQTVYQPIWVDSDEPNQPNIETVEISITLSLVCRMVEGGRIEGELGVIAGIMVAGSEHRGPAAGYR
jgi:hypothetical protein